MFSKPPQSNPSSPHSYVSFPHSNAPLPLPNTQTQNCNLPSPYADNYSTAALPLANAQTSHSHVPYIEKTDEKLTDLNNLPSVISTSSFSHSSSEFKSNDSFNAQPVSSSISTTPFSF